MKIVLTTTYDNIDEKWLQWYLRYLDGAPQPEVREVAAELKECNEAGFTNRDPSDPRVIGTTIYQIFDRPLALAANSQEEK